MDKPAFCVCTRQRRSDCLRSPEECRSAHYVRPVFSVKRKSSPFDVVLLFAAGMALIATSFFLLGTLLGHH